MKSLLIADLLIIIAFFALNEASIEQEAVTLTIDLPEKQFLQHTVPVRGVEFIEIERFGSFRYVNEEDTQRLRRDFFNSCVGQKKCELKMVVKNNRLEWEIGSD